ncbi:MAG: RNA polymerase sigma factor WhiG [Actinobacteria bacterium]|nr:RNA polymerase sigma factor WhiG [Actinomycetota bacterium]
MTDPDKGASIFKAQDAVERTDPVADRLWSEHRSEPTPRTRENIILHYSNMVKYVAGRVSVGLPPSVEYGDLVSYGVVGLLDAIEKFNPERGVKFETYAVARIKGAIIDELRAGDWVPRSVRSQAREIEKAYAVLEGELRRAPTDQEVAEKLKMTREEYLNVLGELSFVSIVALDELISVGGERSESISIADTLPDSRASDPLQTFELEEMKDAMARAIDELPVREKTIVSLYYYEGLTMREIAAVFGVSEARICQMHTRAILRLRGKLTRSMGTEQD